jgi:hypothetical protein
MGNAKRITKRIIREAVLENIPMTIKDEARNLKGL